MTNRLSFPFLIFALSLASCLAPPPITAPTPPATLTLAPPTPPASALVDPTTTPRPAVPPLPDAPTPILLPVPPDPDAYRLRPVVGALAKPVALTHAGDGRLFIVEQPGLIRLVKDGALLSEPFLDLRHLITDAGTEQGLLGLAFPPDYALRGVFYVNYTDRNGDTAVVRYHVSSDPDRADPASAELVLAVAQPYRNHNGGDLAFGPDGYLYIGLGDGGSGGDPQGNGQNLQVLLGKMLRIDVNSPPYLIPPDNPFAGGSEARLEIWASGLRNPWRYSFDRATGDLYIADVGQGNYEEVNYQPRGLGGLNYGWNFMEGLHPYQGAAPEGLTAPVAEYSHAAGGCSVTGGYVYRGPALPQLNGVYLYGDYCSGQVWALYRTTRGWVNTPLLSTGFSISSFGEDAAGELYLLDHWGGAVYQWVAAP